MGARHSSPKPPPDADLPPHPERLPRPPPPAAMDVHAHAPHHADADADAGSVASGTTATTATTTATGTTLTARRASSSRGSGGHQRVSSAGSTFARMFRGSRGESRGEEELEEEEEVGAPTYLGGDGGRAPMNVEVVGREEYDKRKLEAEYEEYNQTGLTAPEIRAMDRYSSVPEREQPPDYVRMRDADRERRESRAARRSERKEMKEARKTEKLQRRGKVAPPVVHEKGSVGYAVRDAMRLGVLNLAKMGLGAIPDSVFDDLPGTTRVINVSSNDLVSIDPRFTEFVLVQRLVANENRITAVPAIISRMTALRKLDLASNMLTAVPDSFANMPHLEHVDLSDNQLSSLPDSFVSLNLISLRLSGNKFTTPPRVIDEVSTLKELYLDRNNLVAIPPSWSKLENLHWLVLDENNLSDFPDEILAHCTRLETLSVRSNPLKLATLESKPNWHEHEARLLRIHMPRVNSGMISMEDLRLNELRVADV